MTKKILLFDFDGVIVSNFDVCFEISRTFHPELSKDEYLKWFEGNIHDRPKRADHTEKSDLNYFDVYSPRLLEMAPVPGIAHVLQELHRNYVLIIVSSTINGPIKEYLELHDFLKYFDEIFGADVHKSKVEKIKMVFKAYHAIPTDCLFITDTLGDMREAEQTGVQALGVTWGYHPQETLARGNPIAIAEQPSQILTEVNQYFQK